MLATARRMLQEHELRSSASQPQGALQLGVVPTAVPVATLFAVRLRQRYPGIAPVVRSLNSQEIELGLENLSLDLGLGFVERLSQRASRFDLLALGDVVTVQSRCGAVALHVRRDDGMPQGAVFIPFAYYEAAANQRCAGPVRKNSGIQVLRRGYSSRRTACRGCGLRAWCCRRSLTFQAVGDKRVVPQMRMKTAVHCVHV